MADDKRIRNEIHHGEYIKEHGEEIWNWSSPAGKKRWARRCSLFIEFIGSNKRHVLEVGCGTGLFTQEIAVTDNSIVAIDISEPLIRKARERVSARNVNFIAGNAYKTAFKSESFDFIVGSSSLHHLDVDSALKEFVRILKPGGRIMFTEPNMMNPQVALIKNLSFIKRWAGDSPDETAFFRWNIARKLRNFGFVEVSVEPFDFMHPSIPASLLNVAERLTAFFEKIYIINELAGSLVVQGRKN